MRGKTILIIVIVAVLAALVVAAFVLTGILLGSPRSNPKYVAHRGYSAEKVDNTADSFRAAAERGFYGIETDIRETADGVLVCNHDETVKYADGSEKKVSDSTYAELVSKPLKNTKTQEDAYLCTFEEYLKICSEGNKQAFVELKENCDALKMQKVLAAIDEFYRREKITVIAFDLPSLLLFREEDATLDMQYLSETKEDPAFATCLEKGISIDVKQNVLTSHLVKDFHAAGLSVNVWTVNKNLKLTIARLKQVDYVTTDVFCEE